LSAPKASPLSRCSCTASPCGSNDGEDADGRPVPRAEWLILAGDSGSLDYILTERDGGREDRLRKLEELFGIYSVQSGRLTDHEGTRLAWIFSRPRAGLYSDPPNGWNPAATTRPMRPSLPLTSDQCRARLTEIFAGGKDVRVELEARYRWRSARRQDGDSSQV
jgi:hypothetical protein